MRNTVRGRRDGRGAEAKGRAAEERPAKERPAKERPAEWPSMDTWSRAARDEINRRLPKGSSQVETAGAAAFTRYVKDQIRQRVGGTWSERRFSPGGMRAVLYPEAYALGLPLPGADELPPV